MIRIKRPAQEPPVLTTSIDRRRYKLLQVRLALHDMQHGKCCYCERPIGVNTSGKDVEHFRPRRCKDHLYRWENLLLACTDCNGAKWDKFPKSEDGEPLLLDPSDSTLDPEDHIEFIVDEKQSLLELPVELAIPRGLTAKGVESIRVLNLSGGQHTLMRNETLAKLNAWHSRLVSEVNRAACGTGDAQVIRELKNDLKNACGDGQVYAGLARTFRRVHRLERYGIG